MTVHVWIDGSSLDLIDCTVERPDAYGQDVISLSVYVAYTHCTSMFGPVVAAVQYC